MENVREELDRLIRQRNVGYSAISRLLNRNPAYIQQFIKRWEHSSRDLLRMGHASLLQLILMAWYARPQSWAHCGYPGPPQF